MDRDSTLRTCSTLMCPLGVACSSTSSTATSSVSSPAVGTRASTSDAKQREAADLTVWLNRHESRIDHVRVLLSPKTQARKTAVNDYFVPSAWNTKWANLVRRAGIRARPAYQTRHTYACWNLTARGNLAFIANQMGHKDYSMLVTVYGRWIDTESSRELERILEGMQNMARITPKLHQVVAEKSLSC